MNPTKKTANYRNLIIFTMIALSSGWLGAILDSFLTGQPEGNSLGMGLWLLLPVLTGIILRIICRDTNGLGVKPHFRGHLKWYLIAASLYILVTILTVGAALLSGNAELSAFETDTPLSLMSFFLTGGLIKNIFEEFAWRGYLTPKLIEAGLGDWGIYIVSGLIWSLWHAPYYFVFLPERYFFAQSSMGMVLIGCLLMTSWSIMYTELFRLTKSVWPCVLLHAVEDAFPTFLISGGFILFTTTGNLWFNPMSGIIATLLFIGAGLYLRSARIQREM